jgi:chromosome segregation ATPase
MEINSFRTFETLLSEAQARKNTLGVEINYLKKILADKIGAFEQQVQSGQDPEELHEYIDALQKKIDIRTKERDTWDSAISGNDRNSLIYQAAQDVMKEGAEIINKELRREWNSRIAELEEAKAAYLAVCARLGSIQRNAEEISNKLSSGLEGFLPASGVPRLVTAIDLEEFAGPIFPDYNAIKKAFLLGGK